MKRIYVGLCLLLGMSTEAGWAQKARMNLLLNNQDLSYEVRYEDQLVIPPSPLGLNVDNQWLGKDVTFKPATNTTQEGIKTYVVQRQEFSCSLDFLAKGKYTLEVAYDAPGNRKKIEIKTLTRRQNQTFEQELLSGGGCLIKLEKKK